MGQLKLKDLYIGKTDGYNEFLEYGSDVCRNLFFEYPNLDISKLLDGSVYYICGDKGTGKTMLLKYVESLIADNSDTNFSQFIRFKKDVDEDQRNQLKRAALPQAPFEEIIESEIPTDTTIDCVLAWQVYLIKVTVNRLKATECGVFERNETWSKLCSLLDAIYNDKNDTNPLKKILPKIKKGNVEITAASVAKLNLDLEWTDDSKKTVPFVNVGKKVVGLYSSLTPCENRIYVFVDELELSLKKTKKYERDITLIRDLIFAVQYMNEISKLNDYNVLLITAIRNEVYQHVKSKGLEINKPIHDFGIQIALTGLQVPFTVSDFERSINGKASVFEEVELLQKKKAAFILRDLYDIGVIGNYGDFPRFSFKGEKDIDPLLPLTFHYPLLRYFKASIRNKENRLDVYK